METLQLIQWLDAAYPDKIPTSRVDSYELGILVGQRILIEQLKIKLKVDLLQEEEIK